MYHINIILNKNKIICHVTIFLFKMWTWKLQILQKQSYYAKDVNILFFSGTSELYTCSSIINTKVLNLNDLLFVTSQTVRQAILNSKSDIYKCFNIFQIGKNTSLFISCIESTKNGAFKAVKVYENKMFGLIAQSLLVDLASCADQIMKTVTTQINLNYVFVQMCLSKSSSTISKQLSVEIDSVSIMLCLDLSYYY